MMVPRPLFLLLLLLALSACRGEAASTATDTPVPQLPSASTVLPAESPLPATTAAPTPPAPDPAEPAPTVVSREPAPAPDFSTLFPLEPGDLADFAVGLVETAEERLVELSQATIYHILVTIDDSLTHLEGQQEILYTNREPEPLAEIYLRLFPNLAGGTASVADVRVGDVPVTPGYELQRSALRIPLASPLAPGEQLHLSMSFTVEVPVEGGGNYGTFIFDRDVLALAHFYPMVAVYDDEGWNVEIAPRYGDVVYADSSFYRVQVRAPAELVLAASGVAVARESMGEQQQVNFVAGPMRDFYLVASPRFERVAQTVGETTINSYSFPEYMDAAGQALAYAVDAVASYEVHFGPYPFTELDIVSTPTQALGVEYPGIVVNAMHLYEPDSRYSSDYLESVTAHEIAHQWFYSTVGNDQVDEPWLDEALAQYATMLYFEDVYGEAGREGFRRSLEQRWGQVGRAEIPVGLPVAAYEGAAYSGIVYGRGPLFFEALAEKMGEATFADFLRTYYTTHTWGIATTESLRAVAEASCSCDLEPLFAAWIYPEE